MGPFQTSGGPPILDVGAVQSGAALTTTREKVEVFQGFPKTLIDQMCTQETAVLKFNSIEWNLTNLAAALGAGILTTAADAIGEAATLAHAAWTGSGDGPYSITVPLADGQAIVPGSVELLDGVSSIATDDGNGLITGADVDTGTVNYVTGVINVTFDTGQGPTSISGACDLGEYVCATTAVTTQELFLEFPTVEDGTVTLTFQKSGGAVAITDAASAGVLAGSGLTSGTIEYETGKCNLVWAAALSAGKAVVATYTGTKTETLAFGGQITFSEVAIQLKHTSPKGALVQVDVYKAQGNGALEVTFGDDTHNFPMEFSGMIPFDPCSKTVKDWSGQLLPAGKQLFKITITKAAQSCQNVC